MQEICLPKILETILQAVHDGIIVTNREGKIVFYNTELGKLEGLVPEQVVGKNLADVYNNVTLTTSEHLQVMESGRPVMEMRKQYFTSEGKEVNIVGSTFPVWQDGKVVAAYSICHDIPR